MFNLDRWREILDTLWRSKLRSLLTAFSVAWGIFMLVFLLGMGNGLQNGVEQEFADDATNSVWMFSGRTSVPYDGMPVGRRIVFANRDVAAIERLPGVDKITGRFFIGGGRGAAPVNSRVGDKVAPYDVRSVHPDHLYLENTIMVAGRFLNAVDIKDRRKVCVIGEPVARFLFGTTDGVIGRWIEIVSEATVLTVIFGYLGVVAGIALLELVGKVLEKLPDLPFAPPDPSIAIALTAAGVIAVFGTLAGVLPAYYAAKIRPVEALRTE